MELTDLQLFTQFNSNSKTNILQSYLFTTSRYRISLISRRILYKVEERLQWLISQVYKNKKLRKLTLEDVKEFKMQEFVFDINEFFVNEEDKETNYKKYIKALKELRNIVVEFKIKDGNNKYKFYKPVGMIEQPVYSDGVIKFKIAIEILYAMLYFAQGYRKYALSVAYKLNSTYSMRIYELISNQTKQMYYKIDDFKAMFGLENKYRNINDFKRYVLDVAKKDLDENSPITFEYSLKKGKRGKKYEILVLTPVNNNKVPISNIKSFDTVKIKNYDIDKNLIDILKKLRFSNNEIASNAELFSKFSASEVIAIYKDKKKYLQKSKNYKGYLITLLKNKYNELMRFVENSSNEQQPVKSTNRGKNKEAESIHDIINQIYNKKYS